MLPWKRAVAALLLSTGITTAVRAAEAPMAVSPGDTEVLVRVENRCPTFSWGEVDGARSYDLVVYRLGEQGEEAQPALRQSFAGSVDGWTPALHQCLKRGGQYAWSIRAVGDEETSDWSVPSLFQVASGPSEADFETALRLVRQYLAGRSTGPGPSVPSGAQRTASSASDSRTRDAPRPLAAVSGDSALQVSGSPVVTVATFPFALCGARGLRYLDQGDGTVLDCNTGKMWLKDAGCIGPGTWEEPDFGTSIFALVADLNDTQVGSDFGCSDYEEGTYTDWQVPSIEDLCSAGAVVQTCPTENAPDSLIDSSVGPPAVVNATGTGVWSEGDAFVGVDVAAFYWSSTPNGIDPSRAWGVFMNTGFVQHQSRTAGNLVWPVRNP